MYRIIGADQKEYGPVSRETLLQWIAEGRVTGATQVQAEGATDWRPLANFPEFAEALSRAVTPVAGMQPATGFGPASVEYARQDVAAPAIALMIVAIVGIALAALSLMVNALGLGVSTWQFDRMTDMDRLVHLTSGTAGLLGNVLHVIVGFIVLFGAIKMKRLESYAWAMTATILAMIPCISPCCCLGLPIGIWTLIVLLKPEVKAAFP